MADKWDQIRYYAGRGVLSPPQPPTTDAAATQAASGRADQDLTQVVDPNAPAPRATVDYEPTPAPDTRTAEQLRKQRIQSGTAAASAFSKIVRSLKNVDSKAARVPTPGGLGGWALALAFLLFAVVKFGGYTRLQLIWYALTGAADVGATVGSVAGGILQVVNGNAASSAGSSSAGSAGQSAGSAAAAQVQQVPGGFTPRSVAGGGV